MRRGSIEQFSKRFVSYVKRYVRQVARDTWAVSVQQQVITFSAITLITVLVNIQVGLVTVGLSWNTLFAALLVIGISFLIIILFNVIRAPFVLAGQDRERVDAAPDATPAPPHAYRSAPAPSSPQARARQAQPISDRDAVVRVLREYRARGNRFLIEFTLPYPNVNAANLWEQEVERYLREHVGDAAATEFVTGRVIAYPNITLHPD
jgi:hypothetical protein